MKKYPLELETVPDFNSRINTFAKGSTSPVVESVIIPRSVPFSCARFYKLHRKAGELFVP